jgi:hypothetical protein
MLSVGTRKNSDGYRDVGGRQRREQAVEWRMSISYPDLNPDAAPN